MSWKNVVITTLLVLLSSNCSPTRIYVKNTETVFALKERNYETTLYFFLFGILQKRELDLLEICKPAQPALVEEEYFFDDFVITFFTLGILYPKTVKVWCE